MPPSATSASEKARAVSDGLVISAWTPVALTPVASIISLASVSQDIRDVHLTIDPIVLNGDDLIALLVAPLAMVLLALFLRRTDIGIAARAAAERADRASLLGVPVHRLDVVRRARREKQNAGGAPGRS